MKKWKKAGKNKIKKKGWERRGKNAGNITKDREREKRKGRRARRYK